MMRLSKTFNEGGWLLRDDYEESIGARPTFIRASSVGVMIGNGSRAPIILPVPLDFYEGSHLPEPLSPTPIGNLNLALYYYYYILHLIGLFPRWGNIILRLLLCMFVFVWWFSYPNQQSRESTPPSPSMIQSSPTSQTHVHSRSRSRPHHLELAPLSGRFRDIIGHILVFPSASTCCDLY
jgi:hypothetical protein